MRLCSKEPQNDRSMLIGFFLVALLPSGIFGFGKTVYVGGLFEEDSLPDKAFRISITSLNGDRHGNEELPNQYIQAEPVFTINNDSYDMSRTVCDLTNKGVAAIFGPQNKITSRVVQSMCDTMEIPHIAAAWDSELLRRNGLINFHPYSRTLSTVYLQLARAFKWRSFTILYEDTENLIRMNQLLERWDSQGYTITLRELPKAGHNYRVTLKEVRNTGVLNIVVDCSIGILPEVLLQAQQVGLMSREYSYIIASLDLQTIDLEPYQYGDTNITGLRLVDPEDPLVVEVFESNKREWNLENPSQLTVEAALVYDSVQFFGRALKQLDDAIKADVKTSLCDNRDSWEHGSSLMNFMRLTETRGLTGLIKFDFAGYRSNFKLDIISLNTEGVIKIGEWNTTRGIEFIPEEKQSDLNFQNKTFVVLISLTAPYGMLKESAVMETGNDRFEGFGVDIIHEMAKLRGFNYTFQEHDSNYGSKDPETKEWGGMIRKIMDGHADLAITDLTITSDRQEVVDFTMPFMNLGISILFTKPRPAGSNFFSFLLPYSSEVWVWLIISYLFTSLLLFIVGRLCPDEWNNPYPCIEEPEELENQLSFKNSLWFNLGAFMQQGSEIAPIGLSTRMMAGAWWLFCLIIVQSYTANLAACLVIVPEKVLIKSVNDLLDNPHGIEYGAKGIGSTFSFFESSTDPVHSKIFQHMMKNKDKVLVDSNDKGVEKVLNGNDKYAFFMESSTIAYEAERKCELQQVGSLLDNKGYGIAMKKHSPYRQSLSTALLTLQESGVLSELQDKWWRQKRGGGSCAPKKETSDAEALGTENVGGVFAVLVVGVALSCLYTTLELFWKVRYTSIKDNVSFKEEMKEELKFIFRCNGTVKPVRRRDRRSSSNKSMEDNSPRGHSPPYGYLPSIITTTPEEKR